MKDFVASSELIHEWNWTRNNELGLDPHQLTLGSNKRAWWQCSTCGHEWITAISNRGLRHTGCPECAKGTQTSAPEMKVYYYVKKYFDNAISGYKNKDLQITEFDIYIPSINTAIEYDGGNWHKNVDNDKRKDVVCKDNNIKLIRVREPKCPKYDSDCIFVYLQNRSLKNLKSAVVSVLQHIGVYSPDVDFDRDLMDIESMIIHMAEDNSFDKQYPQIASEWNYDKNGALTPKNVMPHSGKRVWWKCSKCGHEWVTDICSRSNGTGCPECKKEKIRVAQSESVYCPELGMVFNSGNEAARQTGVAQGHISSCCNGTRRSAGKHPVTGEPLTWCKIT